MTTNAQRPRQQTLQQRRAADAWAQIEAVAASHNGDKFKKEYGSLVRGLPALVQSDGLGQTLAFLRAKAGGDENKVHAVAYRHLSNWVSTQLTGGATDLLEWLLRQSTGDYRRATNEAQAYLAWLKRFAEAKGWKSEENQP